LKQVVTTEFNIEGYPDKRFMELVSRVKPEQATLVPDPPDVLTSNAGWDTLKNKEFLDEIISELKKQNIRTSIFIDTDLANIEGAKAVNTDRIELYTEPYADLFAKNKEAAINPFIAAAAKAKELGIGINAGHDLDLKNLKYLVNSIPYIDEVSIGHALIADALYYGLENTIQMYLQQLS
jgi:pyridoxine 5-phosphate synthase